MADIHEQFVMLTVSDAQVLKKLLTEYRNQPKNLPLRGRTDRTSTNTETFIAKLPSEGIPAMSGTTPGKADCDIYAIDPTGPTLEKVGFQETVWNLSTSKMNGTYITICRDAFGLFLPVLGTGGGSKIYYGTLNATLAVSDSTAQIANMEALDNTGSAGSGTAPTTVDNTFSMKGSSGAPALIVQDLAGVSSTGYILFQVPAIYSSSGGTPTGVQVVTSVNWDGTNLTYSYDTIHVDTVGGSGTGPSGTVTVDTPVSC